MVDRKTEEITRREFLTNAGKAIGISTVLGMPYFANAKDFSSINPDKNLFCDAIKKINEIACPTTTTTTVEPEICRTITRGEIYNLLKPSLEESRELGWDVYVDFWDKEYSVVSRKSLEGFLEYNKVKIIKPGDCDDYTKALVGRVTEWQPGSAFGAVIVVRQREDGKWVKHAKCAYINCEPKLLEVEPQGNMISDWDETWDFIIMSPGYREDLWKPIGNKYNFERKMRGAGLRKIEDIEKDLGLL